MTALKTAVSKGNILYSMKTQQVPTLHSRSLCQYIILFMVHSSFMTFIKLFILTAILKYCVCVCVYLYPCQRCVCVFSQVYKAVIQRKSIKVFLVCCSVGFIDCVPHSSSPTCTIMARKCAGFDFSSHPKSKFNSVSALRSVNVCQCYSVLCWKWLCVFIKIDA